MDGRLREGTVTPVYSDVFEDDDAVLPPDPELVDAEHINFADILDRLTQGAEAIFVTLVLRKGEVFVVHPLPHSPLSLQPTSHAR